MSNKGISEIPLYDPNLPKMDCSLFEVTTVMKKDLIGMNQVLTQFFVGHSFWYLYRPGSTSRKSTANDGSEESKTITHD